MNIGDMKDNIWIKFVLFVITMIFFLTCGLILLNFYFNSTSPVFFMLEIPLLLLMLNVLRKIAT